MKKSWLLVLISILFLVTATSCNKMGSGLTSDEKKLLAETMDVSEGAVEAAYELVPLKCDQLSQEVVRNICVTQGYGSGGYLFKMLEKPDALDTSFKSITKDDMLKKIYTVMKDKVIDIDPDKAKLGFSIKVEDKFKISKIAMGSKYMRVEDIDKALDTIEEKYKDIASDPNWVKETSVQKFGRMGSDLSDKLKNSLSKEDEFKIREDDLAGFILAYYVAQKVLISQADTSLKDEQARCERIEKLIITFYDAAALYIQKHPIAPDFLNPKDEKKD